MSKWRTVVSIARQFPVPICLLIAAIGLSLFSLGFLVSNFLNDFGSSTLKKPFAVINAPISPPYNTIRTSNVEATVPTAVVSFQIQRQVWQENKAIVAVTLTIPDEIKKQFWIGGFDGHYLTTDEVLKSHADSVISINLLDEYETSSSAQIAVPLKEVFALERNGIANDGYTVITELPLFGQQNPYPNDWNLYGALVSLSLPTGISIFDRKSGWSNLPLRTEVGLGIGMPGRALVVFQNSESGVPYYVKTEFEIVRSTAVKWYTYAMATVPIGFVIILLHSFFANAGKSKGDNARSSIFETLAVVLAVLPLRLVLVPSEITELTRVDLILGCAITFTFLLFVVKYVSDLQDRLSMR
jgi:hypothetical protein